MGSWTGTCQTLPSVFAAFRKTPRLDEVPLDKLVLRPTTVRFSPKARERK